MATDNMMKVRFTTDFTNLDILDASIMEIANLAVRDTMEEIHTIIMSRWSETSPSSPGEPPAVVTGTLGSSIRFQPTTATGKFSSASDAVAWSLQVEAEYGAALEFGVLERNLAPRPFIRPAIQMAQDILGNKLLARLTFGTSKFTVLNPFEAQRVYVGDVIGALG